ncbi:hypothetical protein [Aeromicrobium sp.]|uniref:hypothetical protein n=1 Tax=Aeromicrobium sp. TaxID=1871063 RepID=UPI002FC8B39D
MPRLRVDRDTSEAEIVAAIHNLFAASHVIDAELASGRLSRSQRHTRADARDNLHDEIERLTNIVRYRRSRVPA